MHEAHAPIGIFDSGVGGLTVLRRVREALPDEGILYLGDTARVPYGTKSRETVIRYARACARILTDRGIKMLVVACNTASAHAIDALRQDLYIPVIDVVEPGARAAAQATGNGRIGVIGTAGTVSSGAYQDAIQAIAPGVQVFSKACPLFVPLAEEGWTTGEVPARVAETYLAELLQENIDTLVLGCTHYPLLHETIARVAGPAVTIVDSACETALVVRRIIDVMGLHNDFPAAREIRFLVSDAPASFERIGRQFLGYDIGQAEWVDFQVAK
ncbi:MAG: glutamate racemase [Candidatus Hydrogenedentes bacterium]|nr:glutamate racemase [Candidatus Hydrogenedentota bacterium]